MPRDRWRAWGRLRQTVVSASQVDGIYGLTLRCSALLLLLHSASTPFLTVPVTLACGLMLLFPRLVYSSLPWWLVALALLVGNAVDWYSIDNHKYLITYWALAIAISLHFPEARRRRYLATTARIAIGLVFLFAVLWKLWAGEYLDGSFLYVTFLVDSRLEVPASLVSRVPIQDLMIAREAIATLGSRGISGAEVPLVEAFRLYKLTLVMSWLTVVGEACIAVLFLSGARRLYHARHYLLMTFILMTYFLLPVIGFAIALTVMGLAQCRAEDSRLQMEYLVLLGFVHFTLIPWQSIVTRLI